MSGNLEEAAVRFVRRMAELLREDAELRDSLRDAALAILHSAKAVGAPPPTPQPQTPPPPQEPDFPLDEAVAGLKDAFSKGGFASETPVAGKAVYTSEHSEDAAPKRHHPPTGDSETLERLKTACTIKFDATQWAIERMRKLDTEQHTDEINNTTQEMFKRANATENCFLWMLGTFNPTLDSAKEWILLAEAFGCLSRTAELLQTLLPEREDEQEYLENALDLAAEAQSALRVAVTGVGQGYDPSQVDFYKWLRGFAADRHIYLPRYMRQTDLADPAMYPDLQDRIDALEEEIQNHRGHHKRISSLINKARYHAQRIEADKSDELIHDWMTLAESIEQVVNLGIQPSDKKLREILLPIVELLPDLPEELPKFDLALREVDRFIAMTPAAAPAPPEEEEPSPVIARARQLLAGKSIVIIGGEARPQAERALEEALGVESVKWVPGAHHQSIEGFKPHIIRDEVAVVCLLIRWSSHSFGEIKSFCDAYGKPLVRLPGGYAPNQVAHQILEQIGERLEV